MPRKGKTHSGAKKRFKITVNGKIMRRKSYRNHLLEKKSTKRKRTLSGMAVVTDSDHKRIAKIMRVG